MHQAHLKHSPASPRLSVEAFADTDTLENSYLVRTGRGRALVIDPNASPELLKSIAQLGAGMVTVALTHAHADHISGLAALMERFPVRIACSEECAQRLLAPSKTGLEFLLVMLRMQDTRDGGRREERFERSYRPCTARAQITFTNAFTLAEGAHRLRFIPAPGHSPGSCIIVLDDECAFTGDSLFADRAAVTRFPRGSTRDYRAKTVVALKSLPQIMPAFPGHGAPFILRDGVYPA